MLHFIGLLFGFIFAAWAIGAWAEWAQGGPQRVEENDRLIEKLFSD